jgi:hypothetical protein
MAIDFGDFWQMPDYRQGMGNKNASGIARLARTLDPMTYIPGIKEVANPIHNLAEQGADFGNQVLSPVVGAAQKFTELTTPGLKQVQNAVPFVKDIDRFVRDKPVDAAAIAAATFFTAGAATPALTGAGTGGALGAAGSSAATSALTPAFTSAAGTAAGAAPSALTTAAGAGGAGLGTLGSAGTAAGLSALTPAFQGAGLAAGTGAAGSAGSNMLSSFNNLIKPLKTAKNTIDRFGGDYVKNLKNFAEPDREGERQYKLAEQLAERVINDKTQPDFSRFKKFR